MPITGIDEKYLVIIKINSRWEPKSQEIESFENNSEGSYVVVFQGKNKQYSFKPNNIKLLKDREWYDPKIHSVYILNKGYKNLYDIKDIWRYYSQYGTFWRIEFESSKMKTLEFSSQVIEVVKKYEDKNSQNILEYIKEIAHFNPLGKDGEKQRNDEVQGLLSNQYQNLNLISFTVSNLYLNPGKKISRNKCGQLIFPFGCNISQMEAVENAMSYQLSVIQGPPGTGKTQTILNIIANLIMQGKSVLVVSSNNSATENIKDKLNASELDFFVAPLGNDKNKNEFIDNQPKLPDDISSWHIDEQHVKSVIKSSLEKLELVFKKENDLAVAKQELRDIELEWEHFKKEIGEFHQLNNNIPSSKLLYLWLKLQKCSESEFTSFNFLDKFIARINWIWLKIYGKFIVDLKTDLIIDNLNQVLNELQSKFYPQKVSELKTNIERISKDLEACDSTILMQSLKNESLDLLKSSLYKKYSRLGERKEFKKDDLYKNSQKVLEQYPVILSTTFSARKSLSENTVYDYVIMDEASQVSIETGFLALTCAKNAVIVGDLQQLPNVVTLEDKLKFQEVFKRYNINDGYDCSEHSLLSSICSVISGVPQKLLCEHYRCHPKIINYCNQKFYGGKLIIRTEDNGEKDVLRAIKSNEGKHKRAKHINQREIDIIDKEILPDLTEFKDIGIITPYKEQVEYINKHFNSDKLAATVHKYQGKENDVIIMSTVDDKISNFCDDPNMINVAVSRAVKRFWMVTSGNEQRKNGNIADLLNYIDYNKCEVQKSNLHSIFDYMYDAYSKEREVFLSKYPKISKFVSENLTYGVIREILEENPNFSHIKVICHVPLRHIFDISKLESKEERDYAGHRNTHTDFLLISRVTKLPILAIETDGSDHINNEIQIKRDAMKDSIFNFFEIPLLRLSTSGYDEKNKITKKLNQQESILEAEGIRSSNKLFCLKFKEKIVSLNERGINIINDSLETLN